MLLNRPTPSPALHIFKGAASLGVDLLGFRSTLRIPKQTVDDRGRLFARTFRRSIGSQLVGAS